MEQPSSRQPRRRGRLLSAIAATACLVAGCLVTFALPASSASAEAIDCSYSPGLSVFIGRGRDGVTCLGGGTRSPGDVYGSGSLPGQVVPAGAVAASACHATAPAIPDRFYGYGTITASSMTVGDYTRSDGSRWHRVETWYFRDGVAVGWRDLDTSPGRPFEMTFLDKSLSTMWSNIALAWTFNCAKDGDWVPLPTTIIPSIPLTPGDPPPPASVGTSRVTTVPTMAPVPFQPNKYFLRVDVVSHADAPTTTPVSLTLDLWNYAIKDTLGAPADVSCPLALPEMELCILPSLEAGQTKTLTFLVERKTGAPTDASVGVTAAYDGQHKVGAERRLGLEWSRSEVRPSE